MFSQRNSENGVTNNNAELLLTQSGNYAMLLEKRMISVADLSHQMAYRQFSASESIKAGLVYSSIKHSTFQMLFKSSLCPGDFKMYFKWLGWVHRLKCRAIVPIDRINPSRNGLGEFNEDPLAYHCMIIFAGNQKALEIACEEILRVVDEQRKSLGDEIQPPFIIVASEPEANLDIQAIKDLPILTYMALTKESTPRLKSDIVNKLENIMQQVRPAQSKCVVM